MAPKDFVNLPRDDFHKTEGDALQVEMALDKYDELELWQKIFETSLQTLLANPKYFGQPSYAVSDARIAATDAVGCVHAKVRLLNT